jgi:hypothetical protein
VVSLTQTTQNFKNNYKNTLSVLALSKFRGGEYSSFLAFKGLAFPFRSAEPFGSKGIPEKIRKIPVSKILNMEANCDKNFTLGSVEALKLGSSENAH